MRPYKIVIGCTQILPAMLGTESIKLQLYSQQDYKSAISACKINPEINEQVTKGDISSVSFCPPEVTCSQISLPYVELHIRVTNIGLKDLLNKLRKLFPKNITSKYNDRTRINRT